MSVANSLHSVNMLHALALTPHSQSNLGSFTLSVNAEHRTEKKLTEET